MSALFGVFQKNKAPVVPERLVDMQRVLAPWGGDGQGVWQQEMIGLGHLLLHETPESLPETQPWVHPGRGDLVITADARLDNRDDLFAALHIPESERTLMPDSVLILRAYETWGPACTEKLIGAFAFAIWDGSQHCLFCGRDHIGFKPFLYYDGPDLFVFASDIKGLLAYPEVPCRLYAPLLAAYLQQETGYAEKRATFYEDIVKLPPAHQLTVTPQQTRLAQYWSTENITEVRYKSQSAYVEHLQALLRQAVQCRLRSPGAVGAHLSSGLDSSAISVLAARQLRQTGQRLKTYSWSPPPSPDTACPDDERMLIREICAREDMSCAYIQVTQAHVLDIDSRDFTVEPVHMLLREEQVQTLAAQDQIRVLLSGWGGDEAASFNGRGYLHHLILQGAWGTLAREIAHTQSLKQGAALGRMKHFGHLLIYRLLKPLVVAPVVAWWRTDDNFSTFPQSFIQPDFARQHQAAVIAMRSPRPGFQPNLRQIQHRLINNGHLTKRIEAWAGSGAKHRLVYRYPLLDRRVLEFCLGLPAAQFYRQGQSRYLFRQALAGILPDAMRLSRNKDEPAGLGALANLFPGVLANVFEQAYPPPHDKLDHHPVAQFVDIPRLKEAIYSQTDIRPGIQAVRNALACFTIKQIYTQSYARP